MPKKRVESHLTYFECIRTISLWRTYPSHVKYMIALRSFRLMPPIAFAFSIRMYILYPHTIQHIFSRIFFSLFFAAASSLIRTVRITPSAICVVIFYANSLTSAHGQTLTRCEAHIYAIVCVCVCACTPFTYCTTRQDDEPTHTWPMCAVVV